MRNTPPQEQTEQSNLRLAQSLHVPSREAMLQRDPSVARFWSQNSELLCNAWIEWEESEQGQHLGSVNSLLNSKLRNAIETAWADPSKEKAVEDLWEEVSPGVFECQFFNPDRLIFLRDYLTSIQEANIPLRPPYGIALNRFGAMLDERSEGYLATPSFQSFYRLLMDKYMRPIARLLFPEIFGYDEQTFGFSIQYQPGIDTALRLHSDASAATLNINLNLPDESYSGSEIDFYDPVSGKANRLVFRPGVAVLHRGTVPHAARPITAGQRTNIVLWLYGNRMQVPQHSSGSDRVLKARDRWTIPRVKTDKSAPF